MGEDKPAQAGRRMGEMKGLKRIVRGVFYRADRLTKRYKVCCCCGQRVKYNRLPAYYREMERKYGCPRHVNETLSRREYKCPNCGANDRDRLMILMLEKLGVGEKDKQYKVLQFAPSPALDSYIKKYDNISYETTDLYMDGVTFQADIQDMSMVADDTYDLIICSHVLEHVKDDRRAMREIKRIMKPEGCCLFLVPISLDIEEIDEEWGLSEAENWRRFGQNDHCRRYSWKGLLERLSGEGLYVTQITRETLGGGIFKEQGLLKSSTLYLLKKREIMPDERR